MKRNTSLIFSTFSLTSLTPVAMAIAGLLSPSDASAGNGANLLI
ncbi:hypothetical protein [Enterobacter roggenkampii]|nr:hypothetical protein [Enterobacter roggenkampii]